MRRRRRDSRENMARGRERGSGEGEGGDECSPDFLNVILIGAIPLVLC